MEVFGEEPLALLGSSVIWPFMTPYRLPNYQPQRSVDLEEATNALYRAKSLINSAALKGEEDPHGIGIDHAIVDELQRIDKIQEQHPDSMFPSLDYQEVLDYARGRLGEERADYIEYQAGRLQGEEKQEFDRMLHLSLYVHALRYG